MVYGEKVMLLVKMMVMEAVRLMKKERCVDGDERSEAEKRVK